MGRCPRPDDAEFSNETTKGLNTFRNVHEGNRGHTTPLGRIRDDLNLHFFKTRPPRGNAIDTAKAEKLLGRAGENQSNFGLSPSFANDGAAGATDLVAPFAERCAEIVSVAQ